MIKAEWANEQHLKLSREAKEATETLRKQIFTQQMAEADEIVVSEFHSENDKEVMPDMKGGGTSHCLEEYQTVLIPGCSRSQCGGYKW